MLRIPYVPRPYPDETLGSLLTRLLLYNGAGLWRSLLEESGYGRRTISPFYVMPVQDSRLDHLLHAVGHSHRDMLHQLTAFPFWLAFNNASYPRGRIAIDEAGGSSTRLYLVGKEYNLAGARFCPACLAEDLKTCGEPYLHRHHQLPVAVVCAKHGEWLRMTCGACGITVQPFSKALLKPMALRCTCGQDLSRTFQPVSPESQRLQHLSQFAESTLTCTKAPWTAHHVRAFLVSKMNWNSRSLGKV